MMSSRIVSLFTEPPPARTGPSSFVISALLHAVVCALVLLGVSRAPRVDDPALARRYTVRLLKLHQPQPQPRLRMPGAPDAARAAMQAVKDGAAGTPSAARSAPQQTAQVNPATQTLVQPDLPKNLLLAHEVPIPKVLMWSAENSTARVIVAPPPQPLTAVRVHPSLEMPNREVNLADVKISASDFISHAPSLPPTNTAPIPVEAAHLAEQVPSSASQAHGIPTPARVLSLSDLEMPEGTVALPMANQTAASSAAGLAMGHEIGPAENGAGKEGVAGSGPGQGAGQAAGEGAGSGRDRGSSGGVAVANNGTGAAWSGEGTPEGSGEPAVTHIRQRKDGKFGVVVVGSSIADAYPETAGVWSGRLAYTVYLHVGLAKSWILQYALPRAAVASVAGTVTRPDAPWPYDIIRPRLAPGDFNANAILVHGMVNAAGKFEKLGVVFPADFAQSKFLLSSLEQWEFRPAMENGQIAAVEILLIIPEETE